AMAARCSATYRRAPAAVTRSCTTANTTSATMAVVMRTRRGRTTICISIIRSRCGGGGFARERVAVWPRGRSRATADPPYARHGGVQLMNIREVMTPNPQCVAPGDSIQNAARIMRDCDTGAVPVVDNGRPVGIVTDRDIVIRAVADGGQLNRPVRDIVSSNIVCVTPDMSTHEAADLMSEHQVRRLPVVENERIVGIVSLGDRAVKEAKDKRVGDTLEHISEGVKERG